MASSDPGRRRRNVLLLAFVVFLVNFPVVQGWWLDRQVASDGVETTATVVGLDRNGSGAEADHFVSFRFSEDVDPEQEPWLALVDGETWSALEIGGDVPVRVVPGSPAAHEVEGQVESRVGVVATLVADVVIGLVALLLWRRRPRPADEPPSA
jgi:hypothetical protein